ncbi:MAG: 3-methyl-2-oxobutanoate dehydrogenase subunit VorB [bacterium]
MEGNEAVAEAAIRAGCTHYFGYPITPQNQITAYMAAHLPRVGGTFIQAESELAAINMVFGAAAAGARAMTSSSSPGISLKQEGISYLAGAELPAVIVNVMRGGPGLGNIAPSQSDYFQATKGGGHGDYRTIVLAPNSVQEMADFTMDAFDLADRYRNPVVILGDGVLGQMMEPMEFRDYRKPPDLPPKDWALTGAKGRRQNRIVSLFLEEGVLEEHNERLWRKYETMAKREVRSQTISAEDADIVIVAFGLCSRVALSAMNRARKEGIRVGLIRPITLWPYPYDVVERAADTARAFLVVEMNKGQMVEDVRLGVNGKRPVHFFGRAGGGIPDPEQVFEKLKKIDSSAE